jgi:cysteine desulfuration protein SufE
MVDFETIKSDFELLDDWEDRYRYVIELGRGLPPLAAELKSDAYKVRGCASQVWLIPSRGPGADPVLNFIGDSDAHIVRGLVAILLAIYDGHTASEILGIDGAGLFAGLKLSDHLTPQRSNGLASMISRIQAEARASLTGASGVAM